MRRSRSGVLAALVLVLLLLASCATRTDRPGGSATSRVPARGTDRAGCQHTGSTFALSLALDRGGQATPLAAVVHFGDRGGVPGYQAPADQWVSVQNPMGSEGQAVHAVTLRTDDVFLHVVHLADDTWAVDSGGHCATPS